MNNPRSLAGWVLLLCGALMPAAVCALFAALPGPASPRAAALAAPPRPARLHLAHETSFVVYPADTNHLGTLFGGKTLAEMDRCAGVTVRRLLYASAAKRAVTARVTDARFAAPGRVGDLLFVRGEVVDLGTSSVTVRVTVQREDGDGGRAPLAEATFTFVCVNDKGAVSHGLELKEE